MPYRYVIGLQGHALKDKTKLVFDIGSPADHAAALNAANQIRGSLVDVTKANVAYEHLTDVISESGVRPADESADTFEEVAVTVYLDATGDKTTNLRIPAPEGIVLADGVTVDIASATLIQYVQQVSQHAFVSDGEQIDTTINNGIKQAWVRTKAKSFR